MSVRHCGQRGLQNRHQENKLLQPDGAGPEGDGVSSGENGTVCGRGTVPPPRGQVCWGPHTGHTQSPTYGQGPRGRCPVTALACSHEGTDVGSALGSLGGETTNGGREERLLPPLGTLGENTVSRTWPLEGKRASQEGGRGQGGKWSTQVTHLPGLSSQNFRDTGQTGPWTEGPTKASTRSYVHACSRGPHPTSCQPLSGNKHAGARTTLGRRQPSGPREEIRGPQTLCRDALAFVLTQKQLPQGPEPRRAAPRSTPSSGEAHQRGTHRRLWTVCSDMKQSFRKERPFVGAFWGNESR